ncbi:MAG: fibrillin [Methanoculleus sp. SDB]|nr:MAG: fibrillin [Methanoculleus sp. SDB]
MILIDGVLVSPGEGGVYGERMLKGYRVWDPYRSKFAALAHAGVAPDLLPGMVVLYLGAANGTTVSHVADYVDTVYAVEYAPRPMQDLLEVARRRKNVVPIFGDATRPAGYASCVESVDLLYQDVAQPDQVGIFVKNAAFLKKGGTAVLMLKARSVDVRRDPAEITREAVSGLEAGGFSVRHVCRLDPYHRDHAALVVTRR